MRPVGSTAPDADQGSEGDGAALRPAAPFDRGAGGGVDSAGTAEVATEGTSVCGGRDIGCGDGLSGVRLDGFDSGGGAVTP